MMIVATMVSFLALLIGLVAMWMAGGASRKAETQHHSFYEAHIKSLKLALSDVSRTVGEFGGQSVEIKKAQADDKAVEALDQRLSTMERKVDNLGDAIGKISTALSGQNPG